MERQRLYIQTRPTLCAKSLDSQSLKHPVFNGTRILLPSDDTAASSSAVSGLGRHCVTPWNAARWCSNARLYMRRPYYLTGVMCMKLNLTQPYLALSVHSRMVKGNQSFCPWFIISLLTQSHVHDVLPKEFWCCWPHRNQYDGVWLLLWCLSSCVSFRPSKGALILTLSMQLALAGHLFLSTLETQGTQSNCTHSTLTWGK